MLYFNDYKRHSNCKIKPSLLWEYETDGFDYEAMRNVVVQRVLERGWKDDFYAMFNYFSESALPTEIDYEPELFPTFTQRL